MQKNTIKEKVINGNKITKEEATSLLQLPFKQLINQANEIRKHYCGNTFDPCTIINIKSGKCTENCKFCSQSQHYNTKIKTYPLLTKKELKTQTLNTYNKGIKRISYVASGKTVTDNELETITETIKELKENKKDIKICVSLGLLTKKQIQLLEDSGVDRLHNNLETSEKYFKQICTTHKYQEKLETLKQVNNNNIKICSGGIFGLGESFQDRIDLALQLREYNIQSIPINILNPIKGTPLENNKILTNQEVCKIVAIFRFINPKSYIRLAGGRLLLPDKGKLAFQSGANAAILGDMLTTSGVQYKEDVEMLNNLGYEIKNAF